MMRLLLATALLTSGAVALSPTSAGAVAPGNATIFISEIHYDNVGTDTSEAVEIFAPAGTDLTGWSIVRYNGNVPAAAIVYTTPAQTSGALGVVPDEGGTGFGVLVVTYAQDGLQNGGNDAVALVDNAGTVRQFLSYEGVTTASNGPAAGLTSTDIGVSETSAPLGQSLQLVGTGTTYGSLTWQAGNTSTFGSINGAGAFVTPPSSGDNCPNAPQVTRVDQVQGTTDTSPCVGESVVIDGVVVGDYEGAAPALRGFYVQEDDADVDADPATSEGVFVFNGANTNLVSVGDRVQVTGTVAEFQGQTQIGLSTVTVLSSGASVTAATPSLPMANDTAFERYEGMRVIFGQTLVVTEMFQLGRFGQVMVSSDTKLDQPTQVALPGAPAQALQAANLLDRMFIDDTENGQNPDPIVLGRGGQPLSASNTLRGGDSVTGATGVLTYTWSGNSASGNAWRLRPVSPTAGGFDFQATNPRPTVAPAVGGTLRVISANVLNYFLTLDTGGIICGPVGNKQQCRGAENATEFQRQRTKLLAALQSTQADIFGLAELENTPGVDPVADIVNGLNALAGPGTYAGIATGAIGTDTIRVGIIYRTSAVAPVGSFATLTAAIDPRFDTSRNRPALAQTFRQNSTGEKLTIVVNHLKSKGSCPTSGADADQGDGQGCWNPTRTAAVQALLDWLGTDPTASGDTDFLLLGDYNSYGQEDPMRVFAQRGYVDLADRFGTPYSYVFDGQWGTLDYALASPSLVAQVVGAAEHHINSDEPSVLDYNTNFKSAGQIASLYAPDRYRVSDHDQVVVGLQLGTVTPPAEVPETSVTVLLGASAAAVFGLSTAHHRRRRRLAIGATR